MNPNASRDAMMKRRSLQIRSGVSRSKCFGNVTNGFHPGTKLVPKNSEYFPMMPVLIAW